MAAAIAAVVGARSPDILVDLEDLERAELASLRRWTIGCGVVSILSAITCWTAYITPWIAAAVTVPTCYVAYSRMVDIRALLQGQNCWCRFCGPNPRNTLKSCRPMLIACTVLTVISVITQIAWLATYGKDNSMGSAQGVVSILCLLLLIGLCFALGYYAFSFRKAVMIFDSATARQHLKQNEMGSMASQAVGAITNAFTGIMGHHSPQQTAPPPHQQQQYSGQPNYGQPPSKYQYQV
jgi:aldehyde:ferredoxin oxidoreductase